jgi:Mlc titration factor MtfA (ptsG expression regulator)
MAREEFLLNLRTAARFLSPSVQMNGIRLDPSYIERILSRTPIWLTPGAVEGFSVQDFPDLTPDQRTRLQEAVDLFLSVARTVPPNKPATDDQVSKAAHAFATILDLMRPYLEGFRVYHALKQQKFPPYVRDFAVRVGEDWSGDPATHIWVVVSDDVGGHGFRSKFPEVHRNVEEALKRSGIDLLPYVMIRTETEQEELENEEVNELA